MKISSSSSAARVIGSLFWQAWSRLIGFLKDWLLPERHPVQPEALPEWLTRAWANYLRYREASCPGAVQFRGLTVDSSPVQARHNALCVAPQTVRLRLRPLYYRGCNIEMATYSGEPTSIKAVGKTFVPSYWKLLNNLRLKLHLADMDHYPVTPELQRVYRGRAF
ncbi:MAG: hypothetical protein ACUVRV_08850 [Cyanobacteriota bacterium]